MALEQRRAQAAKIVGQKQGLFDLLGNPNAGVAKGLGRELHEPAVEEIDRLQNVLLPKVRLVGIDRHFLVQSLAAIELERSFALARTILVTLRKGREDASVADLVGGNRG